MLTNLEDIYTFEKQHNHLLTPSFVTVSTDIINSRDDIINQLVDNINYINELNKQLKRILTSCNKAQLEDMKILDDVLRKTGKKISNVVNPDTVPKSPVVVVPTIINRPVIKQQVVYITSSLCINATIINDINEANDMGKVYYLSSMEHFIIRIENLLLHGNIGVIYTDEKIPEKIKDCKFAGKCTRGSSCDYYHDPFIYKNSKDKRNFIASSWLYNPSNYRTLNRRFGCIRNIDKDINNITKEEISRFKDQLTHDLLWGLLIQKVYSIGN